MELINNSKIYNKISLHKFIHSGELKQMLKSKVMHNIHSLLCITFRHIKTNQIRSIFFGI